MSAVPAVRQERNAVYMSDAAGIQPDFSFPVGQFADLYGCRQFPPVLFASDFQRITAVRQFCTIEQNSVSAAGAGYFTRTFSPVSSTVRGIPMSSRSSICASMVLSGIVA